MEAQVRCGPRAVAAHMQWIGKSVSELRKLLVRDLQIPAGAIAVVSRFGAPGDQVSEDYRMVDGDLLEFTRPAGVKG